MNHVTSIEKNFSLFIKSINWLVIAICLVGLLFLFTDKKEKEMLEYFVHPSQIVNVEAAGIAFSPAIEMGKTKVTISRKSVLIKEVESINKVIGIHPEHDQQLNAILAFQYNESDLNGLMENNLILYSSQDEGTTWKPHLNSKVDTKANIIHLEGIEHFSLWTAASAPPPLTVGVLTSDNVYDVTVTVSDAAGLTDVQDLAITVTDESESEICDDGIDNDGNGLTDCADPNCANNVAFCNDAPEITNNNSDATATTTYAENGMVQVANYEATDPDGETENGGGLTWSITGGTDMSELSIVGTTGELTFNSSPDFENPTDSDGNNTYEVEVTVTDGNGLTDVQLLTITVTDESESEICDDGIDNDGNGLIDCADPGCANNVAFCNDAPTITQPPVVLPEDGSIVFCPIVSDNDFGDVLTVSICEDSKNGMSIINTVGCITYTPSSDFNGQDSICVVVCDEAGLCDSVMVVITITPVPDLINLHLKVKLQGALFGSNSAMMRDDLRSLNQIPLEQPYNAGLSVRFTQVGGGWIGSNYPRGFK